jgi:LDH2 family malate/lactate/ureidoglycolate dehydrogenase
MTGRPHTVVRIDSEEATACCARALMRLGAPSAAAWKTSASLVRNEGAGHRSHGLLRLADYAEEAAVGTLRVKAKPVVRRISDAVRIVDGRRGFGTLASEQVVAQLVDALETVEIAAVSLVNSHHLGRLFDIGDAVARSGYITLGFVNYLGVGQRMAPWRGMRGRLCTNPVLFSFPAIGDPFVLDMTTSTVAEGKIRARFLAGRPVPRGWLIDGHGRAVTDPARLYSSPPTAYMAPLGGKFAYKGWGLALAVEVLAGVLTGAGFARPNAAPPGNGGLFIGLRPGAFGPSAASFRRDIEKLRAYIKDCPAAHGKLRFPGESENHARNRSLLSVNRAVWESVMEAASP